MWTGKGTEEGSQVKLGEVEQDFGWQYVPELLASNGGRGGDRSVASNKISSCLSRLVKTPQRCHLVPIN